MANSDRVDLSHHNRLEYCRNRPQYRDGRKATAVKVYTFVNESRHLLVFGVPRINLHQEIKQLFSKYGTICKSAIVTAEIGSNKTVEIEQFTDCYHIEYEKLHCARFAKFKIDRHNFYGGILHVSYAPEYESVADVSDKIRLRRQEVRYRLRKLVKTADVSIVRPSTSDPDSEPPSKKVYQPT